MPKKYAEDSLDKAIKKCEKEQKDKEKKKNKGKKMCGDSPA